MSFFHKQPAMASVMCESDSCNWWKISREDFEKFLDQNPEVKTQIAETLAKREKENKEKLG
jgi:CRP-like cAMP-binding protein